MNIFDVLREKLEESKSDWNNDYNVPINEAIKIVNQVEQEFGNPTICYLGGPCEYQTEDVNHNNGWIPCSVKMPPVETEVWIVAKRKWRDGTFKYVTTTAMYEDGTVLENDSCWRWEDIEGEWNEEEECYIIPEGWWENKHYNPDGALNYAVDDEVIAWQPLPELYTVEGV